MGVDHMDVEPIYTRIYEILERSIQDGRLAEGTVLLESPLAELFGSSRAPVRKALMQLQTAGLIRRFEGRGFMVGSEGAEIRRIDLQPEMLDLSAEQALLRKSFAWEGIYEDVERTIIYRSAFGRFRVNELELARHFNVGRTVARDVLTRLEAMGMVEKDERNRWVIVALDHRRLINLYEIREQLEPFAFGRSVRSINPAVLRCMRERLQARLASYPNVSAREMDDLEFDLHVRCLSACPNTELLDMLQRTRSVLTLGKHLLGVEIALPEYEPFMAEHIAVFDAALSGQVEDAVEMLRHHIRVSGPKMEQRLILFRGSFTPPPMSYIE
ncbi:GntR family transcriptional regulator (plasmid) [Azospirillum oryzae]|uniref:GntR family transcriptional regulator n=1 Tax=Azospirillum oryzae TaxID=286727 RepID=A0A6N1ARD5_9PROT|nr:GntR family transcriptional regulator [Azospirillum oryzae]QKS53979.1 GntR family transcriptional regulator [Azospirillum oryzae]